MIIEHEGDRDRYFAETGDFVIDVFVKEQTIEIEVISQRGDFNFSSGVNLDNLATFIGQVKADVVAKGYNWSGN